MATTPYMSLSLPTVSVTQGPAWATQVNAALTAIDGHDHTPGSGKPIRSPALSIDADVAWNGYNVTGLRAARFSSQGSPLALVPDINEVYVSGGNLYFNNSAGQQIQITAGAALNAASIGGIGGDYSTSTASMFYTSASTAFSLWSAANKYAGLWTGDIKLFRMGETSPNGITIQPPTSLAGAYGLTLPAALPGSTLPMLVASDGVMSLAQLGTTQIADAAVTAAKTDAVSTATASRLMVRDGSGRVAVATPSASGDAATKGYVDGITTSTGVTFATGWNGAGSSAYLMKQANGMVTAYFTFQRTSGTGVQIISAWPAGFAPAIHAGVGAFVAVDQSVSGGSVLPLRITASQVTAISGAAITNGDSYDAIVTYATT